MVHCQQLLGHIKLWTAKHFPNEHKKYAARGFAASSFNDATVICVGRETDRESLTIWHVCDTDIIKKFSQTGPHSIGMWYASMLARVGITLEDQDLITWMNWHGDPERLFTEVIKDFIATTGCGYDPTTKLKRDGRCGCLDWRADLTSTQDLCDIVAATQQVYVYVMHNILCWTKMYVPSNNLILVGSYDFEAVDRQDLKNFYSNIEHYNSLKSLTKTIKVV
jgi:predicted NodU family carbamoyl transferase